MRLLLLILIAFSLFAQAPATPAPARPSLAAEVADPLTLSLVMNGAAQIAESTTDWHFSAAGRHYSVSPAQRAGWACGIGFAAISAAHFKPTWRPYIAGAVSVFNAFLAGRAYVNSLQHGQPVAAAVP